MNLKMFRERNKARRATISMHERAESTLMGRLGLEACADVDCLIEYLLERCPDLEIALRWADLKCKQCGFTPGSSANISDAEHFARKHKEYVHNG